MIASEIVWIALASWFLLAAIMTIAWVVQQVSGNSGWVDTFWTLAVGVTGCGAIAMQAQFGSFTDRAIVIMLLVAVWMARLAGHISLRSASVAEDPRYAKLKQTWGENSSRNMFGFLQLQALCSLPLVLAVTLAANNPAPLLGATGVAAIALYTIGLVGSAIADMQLKQFKQQSAGTGLVCNSGLWAWSRHPNYFFEWLVWVSFALFALNLSGGWNIGVFALIAPACMYWLLRYVSGVPPLEDHMRAKYGAAYSAYQREVSVFFPLPPSISSRSVIEQG